MKDLGRTFENVYRQAMAFLFPLIMLALLVLIVASIAQLLGFPQRLVRMLSPTELAYLCGAVWLWRKAA